MSDHGRFPRVVYRGSTTRILESETAYLEAIEAGWIECADIADQKAELEAELKELREQITALEKEVANLLKKQGSS